MQSKVNLYIHISKTAGTTMRHILAANYDEEHFREIYPGGEEDIPSVSEDFRGLIIGHLDWKVTEQLPTDTRKFTMMRYPVDQVISHFIHLQSRGDFSNDNFMEFLESYQANNWQSQYLSGWKESPDALNNRGKMFRVAAAHLEEIEVCGITEKFEPSLILLKKALGLRYTAYHHRNRSADQDLKNSLKKNFTHEIQKRNEEDLQLYELAKEKLERQLKKTSFYFMAKIQHKWQQRNYRSKL